MESIALSAILIFCQDGSSASRQCADGSQPTELKLNILKHDETGNSLIDFFKDNNLQLSLKIDGTISNPSGIKADDAANRFWQSIAAIYPTYCTWALENAK